MTIPKVGVFEQSQDTTEVRIGEEFLYMEGKPLRIKGMDLHNKSKEGKLCKNRIGNKENAQV